MVASCHIIFDKNGKIVTQQILSNGFLYHEKQLAQNANNTEISISGGIFIH